MCFNFKRLRFLRYNPGEYFKPHFDGSYVRTNGDMSYITVQIYLNEVSQLQLESLSDQSLECLIVNLPISLTKGFKGGSTTFLNKFDSEDGGVEVVPKTGKKRYLHVYRVLKLSLINRTRPTFKIVF